MGRKFHGRIDSNSDVWGDQINFFNGIVGADDPDYNIYSNYYQLPDDDSDGINELPNPGFQLDDSSHNFPNSNQTGLISLNFSSENILDFTCGGLCDTTEDGVTYGSETGYIFSTTMWDAGFQPQHLFDHHSEQLSLLGPHQTCTYENTWAEYTNYDGPCQTYSPPADRNDNNCPGGCGAAGSYPVNLSQIEPKLCPNWEAGTPSTAFEKGPKYYYLHKIVECARVDWCGYTGPDGTNFLCGLGYQCDCNQPPAGGPVQPPGSTWTSWSAYTPGGLTNTSWFDPYAGPANHCGWENHDVENGEQPKSGCGWIDYKDGLIYGSSHFWSDNNPYYNQNDNSDFIDNYNNFLLTNGKYFNSTEPRDWFEFNRAMSKPLKTINPNKTLLKPYVVGSNGKTWECPTRFWTNDCEEIS